MQGVQLVPGERLPAEVHPDRPHPREFLCMLNLSRIRIVDYDFFWIRTVIFQINRIRIVDPHQITIHSLDPGTHDNHKEILMI